MAYHIYISNASSDFFSHFLMDENSGKLTPQSDINLEGAPGAVGLNSDSTRMFVALRSAKQLASYSVDANTGQLTKIGGSSQDEGPPYVYVDDTDSYLLSSYYGSGRVEVHAINEDGTLSPGPIQTLETDGHAHSIQTDKNNRFAFVPHTNPANAIYQFRFDASTGQLSPNDPPLIQPATEEGPRHYVHHPAKDLVYSINENGSTISAHHFDPDKGTLSSFQVISTLPDDFDGDNTTAEIKITPDGKYLYGSNRGHDSLALFAVNDDGTLTTKGHFDTEETPRFFELDPSARFIYSVGQASGGLTSYKIDAETGVLEVLEQHKVGESPLWVTFVKQA